MGYLEWIESNMGWGKWLTFCVISTLLLALGGVWGFYIPEFMGLTIMCVVDSFIVGTIVFIFFMSYTGNWPLVIGMSSVLLIAFIYLLAKPNAQEQLKIQTTAILGAYAVMRGISMLAGGFNSEGQMY